MLSDFYSRHCFNRENMFWHTACSTDGILSHPTKSLYLFPVTKLQEKIDQTLIGDYSNLIPNPCISRPISKWIIPLPSQGSIGLRRRVKSFTAGHVTVLLPWRTETANWMDSGPAQARAADVSRARKTNKQHIAVCEAKQLETIECAPQWNAGFWYYRCLFFWINVLVQSTQWDAYSATRLALQNQSLHHHDQSDDVHCSKKAKVC